MTFNFMNFCLLYFPLQMQNLGLKGNALLLKKQPFAIAVSKELISLLPLEPVGLIVALCLVFPMRQSIRNFSLKRDLSLTFCVTLVMEILQASQALERRVFPLTKRVRSFSFLI